MDDPNAPLDATARIPDPTATPPAASWDTRRPRKEEGRWASLIPGFVLLGIGFWFFAEHTLGIRMPLLRWGQLWPLILIAVGALILLGALRRDRH